MIEHLRAKGQATGVRPNIQRADRRIYSKMIDVGVQSASIVSNRICKIGKKVSKVTNVAINDHWSDRTRGRACFWADLSYSATDRKRTRERVKKTQKKRKREKSRGREKERKRA